MALCDICETNEQKVAFGLLDTGDWKYLCPSCWVRSSLDLIKELMPAEEIAAQLGPMFVRPEREDLHREAERERQKRPRKSKAKTEAPEGEAGGPDEVPTAVADK